MQLNRKSSSSGRQPRAANVASALLEGFPPVMWFIRCKMRQHQERGLSVPQFRALFFIDRYEEASLSQVADHLGCALPTTSRLVSGLVKKKFLLRHVSSHDKRQKCLKTTAQGSSVLEGSVKQTQKNLESAIEHLSREELKTIHHAMELLQKIFSNRSITITSPRVDSHRVKPYQGKP